MCLWLAMVLFVCPLAQCLNSVGQTTAINKAEVTPTTLTNTNLLIYTPSNNTGYLNLLAELLEVEEDEEEEEERIKGLFLARSFLSYLLFSSKLKEQTCLYPTKKEYTTTRGPLYISFCSLKIPS